MDGGGSSECGRQTSIPTMDGVEARGSPLLPHKPRRGGVRLCCMTRTVSPATVDERNLVEIFGVPLRTQQRVSYIRAAFCNEGVSSLPLVPPTQSFANLGSKVLFWATVKYRRLVSPDGKHSRDPCRTASCTFDERKSRKIRREIKTPRTNQQLKGKLPSAHLSKQAAPTPGTHQRLRNSPCTIIRANSNANTNADTHRASPLPVFSTAMPAPQLLPLEIFSGC